MEQRPLAQGAGSRNSVVNVYPDRVVVRDGWQNRETFSVGLREVVGVSLRGLVSCTLTIEVNDGRRFAVERMAPPDARQVKAAIERQKGKASLYE